MQFAGQPVALRAPVCLLQGGQRRAFAFDHEGAVQGTAHLFPQRGVDPADARAELEEREPKLLVVEVQRHGHHAVRRGAVQPVAGHQARRREHGGVRVHGGGCPVLVREQQPRPGRGDLVRGCDRRCAGRARARRDRLVRREIAAGNTDVGQLFGEGRDQTGDVRGGDESLPDLPHDLVALVGEHPPVVPVPLGRLVQQHLGVQPDFLGTGDLRRAGRGLADDLAQRQQHPPPVLHALPGLQADLEKLVQQPEEDASGPATHVPDERGRQQGGRRGDREAAAGAPDHQLGGDADGRGHRRTADHPQDGLHRAPAEVVERPADRGQRQGAGVDVDGAGERGLAVRPAVQAEIVVADVDQVVEAHDGHVVGRPQTRSGQCGQRAHGEAVVRGRDRVRRLVCREHAGDQRRRRLRSP